MNDGGVSQLVMQKNTISYFLFSKHSLSDLSLASLWLHKLVILGILESHQKRDQHISETQK